MDNTTVELAALIARAWLDEEFKEQLKEEKGDHEVFKDSGVVYNESILSQIECKPCELIDSTKINKCHNERAATCTTSRIVLNEFPIGGSADNYDISVRNASIKKTCLDEEGRIIITPKIETSLVVEFNEFQSINITKKINKLKA